MTEPIVSRDTIIESARRAAEGERKLNAVYECPYPHGTAAASLWVKTLIAARNASHSELAVMERGPR